MRQQLSNKSWLVCLICSALAAGGILCWNSYADWHTPTAVVPVASAQTNATPPLIPTNWKKVYSSGTSDFTTTVTSDIYDASNQPNITLAVLSTTGVSAYTVVLETAPFNVSGAAWAQVATVDFTDDGSVASPKWQQLNIPGRYGKIRLRVTAITAGGGNVQLYLCT